MKKFKFNLESMFYYIGAMIFAFVFAIDVFSSIFNIIDIVESQSSATANSGSNILIISAIIEIIIALVMSIILIICADVKFKKSQGKYNLRPVLNLSITAVYLIAIFAAIFAMAYIELIVTEYVVLIIFLFIISICNFIPGFISKNTNSLGKNITNTVIDGLNLIMTIILVAIVFYSSIVGIFFGVFTIIVILLMITVDIIGLAKESILSTPIYFSNTKDETKNETVDNKEENKKK